MTESIMRIHILDRFRRHADRRVRRCAALLILCLAAWTPASAQVGETSFEHLRAELHKLRPMQVAVSGRVTRTTKVVGQDSNPHKPSNDDARLKGTAVNVGGVVSGERTFDWLWSGERWRTREKLDVAGTARIHESSSDGRNWFNLNYAASDPHSGQGSIDRQRGAPTTPAMFGYMPDTVWAEDLLAGMKLRTVRRFTDATGQARIECSGSARNRSFRIVFDPARRYAITEYSSEGPAYASEARVTAWSEAGGLHIPVAMEQSMRSGPSLRDPVWFIQRLTVSNLKAQAPNASDFSPAWPDGARIVNVPESKMYRYNNGRMEFLMDVGGLTPARMLAAWGLIGGLAVGGMVAVGRLRRRQTARSGGTAGP